MVLWRFMSCFVELKCSSWMLTVRHLVGWSLGCQAMFSCLRQKACTVKNSNLRSKSMPKAGVCLEVLEHLKASKKPPLKALSREFLAPSLQLWARPRYLQGFKSPYFNETHVKLRQAVGKWSQVFEFSISRDNSFESFKELSAFQSRFAFFAHFCQNTSFLLSWIKRVSNVKKYRLWGSQSPSKLGWSLQKSSKNPSSKLVKTL